MSVPFMIFLVVIFSICAFIFAKTVSNDAENDYKLRDILANAGSTDDETEEKEEVILPGQEIEKPKFFDEAKPKFANADKQTVLPRAEKNIYQEMAERQATNYAYSTNYKTTAHETENEDAEEVTFDTPVATVTEEKTENTTYSTPVHEKEPKREPEKEEQPKTVLYDEPVYYEKINDDACDPEEYQNDEIEEEEIAEEENPQIYAAKYDDTDEEYYEEDKIKTVKSYSPNGLFGYVKTFWKGITFTLGAFLCLYAAYGIITQAQTPNDALLYSIWLLIGVILIK